MIQTFLHPVNKSPRVVINWHELLNLHIWDINERKGHIKISIQTTTEDIFERVITGRPRAETSLSLK